MIPQAFWSKWDCLCLLSGLAVSPKVIQYPYITQKTKRLGEGCDQVVEFPSDSKFDIYSQAVTSVWVPLPQVTILRTCPTMTLVVE